MENILLTINVILAIILVLLVLLQKSEGGALGIGVCDRMLMLENTWYSVISPEGCASILWRDSAKAPDAADAMKVAPDDLMNMGICDRIVEEPLGGAHRNFDEIAETLKKVLLGELENLKAIEPDTFLERRIARYEKIGVYTES